MCTVINNVETSRRKSYTCLHPFTQWRQMRKSHSDAVEITLIKQVSLVGIRHSNGAKPEEAFLL